MAANTDCTRVRDSGCAEVAELDRSQWLALDQPALEHVLPVPAQTYTAFILPGNGAGLFQTCLQARPVWRVHSRGVDEQSAWHLWWGSNGQACPFKRLRTGDNTKRIVNRVPKIREIATKARLAFHVSRHLRTLCIEECTFVPETHIVSSKLQLGKETKRLHQAAQNAIADGRGSVWIAKPESRNRGIGITVHKSMQDALDHINSGKLGAISVIQKYIENPLLLDGRKFDIRSFVLILPSKQILFYEQSYVRTSSTTFCLDDLSDRSVHLTNDAVQRQYGHYNSFEDHNKLNLMSLQTAINRQGLDISVQNDIVPQMHTAAAFVFGATLPSLNADKLQSCFELLGLDFMVNMSGKVSLIEVNSCPALGMHGAVLQDMIPQMVEEVVQRAIDPYFPGSVSCLPRMSNFKSLKVGPTRSSIHLKRQSLRIPPSDGRLSPGVRPAKVTMAAFNTKERKGCSNNSSCSDPRIAWGRVSILPKQNHRDDHLPH
eukprot:jgi/Ulvmu1/4807/UM020_0092.1